MILIVKIALGVLKPLKFSKEKKCTFKLMYTVYNIIMLSSILRLLKIRNP